METTIYYSVEALLNGEWRIVKEPCHYYKSARKIARYWQNKFHVPTKVYVITEQTVTTINREEVMAYSYDPETANELNTLATRLESLFDKMRIPAEVKAYSNNVTVMFYWEPDPGWFTIKSSENGGFTVEDEYYTEKFDTIQQVVDYLVKKDNDNVR